MFWKHTTDVLVVGAGPVGLTAALSLARQRVHVHIIDEEWRAGAHAYGLALHPHSHKILEHLGVLEEVRNLGRRLDTIAIYDGHRRAATLRLGELPVAYPFVTVLPQSVLEDILIRRLADAGVQVQWEHHLDGLRPHEESVMATVDELEKETTGYAVPHTDWVTERTKWIESKFVIGTDGHRSAVRRGLDLEFPAVHEPEFYAIFEFECDRVPDEVSIVLDDDSRNVLWPLPGGRARWSFQIDDQDIPIESRLKSRMASHIGSQIYPYLTQEDLQGLIAERAPWFDCPIGPVTWSLAVRFERRLVERFGAGRIWLAGDAAHMAGPIGVHSMNMGLREAVDLAGAVANLLQTDTPPTALAELYDRPYQTQWRHLLGVSPYLVPDAHADAFVQANASRLLGCLPASGEDLLTLAGQLHLRPVDEPAHAM